MSSVLNDASLLVGYVPTRRVREKVDSVQFGAVYFRRSAPPREDWERDYKRAAADGHNIFRHWFTWNAINYAPGKYNWEPYDRQLDLAAKYGIKTIIAEFVQHAPEWVFEKYPHARKETIEGHKRSSEISTACLTGGSNAMCLDNPEVAELAEEFLVELVKRYKGHPGLYGYDIFNEYSFYHPRNVCYCPGTERRFQEWLKKKYGSLEKLGAAWFRFSYIDWGEVRVPRVLSIYPECYDWIEFNNDNAQARLRWRAEIIKEHDPDHLITAHGNAKAFRDTASAAGDDWRGGEVVEVFGYTYGRPQRYNLLLAGDLIRMASWGKEFWRAEVAGNTTWQNRHADRELYNHSRFVPGRFYMDHEFEDQLAEPENIRMDCLISLTSGARGYMCPRYRPLLDGPAFGGHGWYGDDGSPTDRSRMMAAIAKWGNDPANAEMWAARPIRGEVGLLMVEEAQSFCYGMYGGTDMYSKDYEGAYEAFYDSNIQCDPIKPVQMKDYDLVYVPFPVAMKDATVSTLLEWVKAGGTLVLEGCPGYLTGHGHLLTSQPNRGLEEALGCSQLTAHLGPDRWTQLKVLSENGIVSGGLYRQSYDPTTGKVLGWYEDGTPAIVGNEYGKGRTLVIGTMPAYAYLENKTEETRRWFVSLLDYAGKEPHLKAPSNSGIIARISASKEGVFLWVVNPVNCDQEVRVYLNEEKFAVSDVKVYRGDTARVCGPNCVSAVVRGRDATIVRLL